VIPTQKNIDVIQELVDQDTDQSLVYAALECRLAIERVCYERLRIAHDYVSASEVKKWQPKQVIEFIVSEVNDQAASTFTLSIAEEPPSQDSDKNNPEQYQPLQFIHVGTQVGFDAKKIGKLWNAVSNFLHVKMPQNKNESVYASLQKSNVRDKVVEVLSELRRISAGTLIASGMGETISFECGCGALNKRRSIFLKHGQIINCINPDCRESWLCSHQSNEFNFERMKVSVTCEACEEPYVWPERIMTALEVNRIAHYFCKCGHKNYVQWRLMQMKPVELESQN
jgi:hypothetical protein